MLECYLRWGAILFATVALVSGVVVVCSRLKQKTQGFGPNSLQALAIVFFLPTVVVISAISEINNPTVAALLGTVAGYILSSPKRKDEESSSDEDKSKAKPAATP